MNSAINYKIIFCIVAGITLVIALTFLLVVGQGRYAIRSNTPEEKSQILPTAEPSTENIKQRADISKVYLETGFAPFAAVMQQPSEETGSSDYVLVFVSKRSSLDGYSLSPDCGGYLTDEPCYLFLEPLPKYDNKPPKLLTTLMGTGVVQVDTVNFIGDEVKFTTTDGDAGFIVTKDWLLNINTNELKLLKETENSSDE